MSDYATVGKPKHRDTYILINPLPWYSTAAQARECGCDVPAGIPDYAVYVPPGVFEWPNNAPVTS